MTRAEKRAVEGAGRIFDAAGWPWRVERRKRHLTLIVVPPNGVAVNIIITEPRDGSGAFIAAAHARRLLNRHGIRHGAA